VSADALRAEARRRVVRRAMLIGLWVWPSFAVLDAWMSFVAYPGAPFARFLVYRIVVEAAFVATWRASRPRLAQVRTLVVAQNVSFALATMAIALMATSLGGIRSPYMHGISIVALVRAAVIPEPLRRAWPHFALIGLAFPVVMLVGALLHPAAWDAWLSRDSLIVFASNYVFVIASALLGMIGSNMVWRAQQQLYSARRIGRYRLKAPIGKGGMGEVWLAWDGLLQRNVALKLLRTGAETGPQAVTRFEREALAASQLQSPHVIQIFDYGASEDGLYYIAMEYLNGMDLQTLVGQQGAVAPARAIHLVMQACLALEVAHAAGVIHRDIKPHNLFLCRADDDPDFIKLLDFGIVRFRDPRGSDLTWTGMLVGTPAYLAPELWHGGTADERTDIYALGVTMYFLLTGQTPRSPIGLDDTPVDLVAVGASAEHRRLTAVIARCLASDPSERVQSARELYEELARIRSGVPIGLGGLSIDVPEDGHDGVRAAGGPRAHLE
jgi:serine/threonine-protein kinase